MVTAATTRKTHPEAAIDKSVPPPTRRIRYAEAPDRGHQRDREAPEGRAGRHAEAPDAGHGRMGTLATEFTHGRSQS